MQGTTTHALNLSFRKRYACPTGYVETPKRFALRRTPESLAAHRGWGGFSVQCSEFGVSRQERDESESGRGRERERERGRKRESERETEREREREREGCDGHVAGCGPNPQMAQGLWSNPPQRPRAQRAQTSQMKSTTHDAGHKGLGTCHDRIERKIYQKEHTTARRSPLIAARVLTARVRCYAGPLEWWWPE